MATLAEWGNPILWEWRCLHGSKGLQGLSEILPIVKIPFVPNPHPLQVDPGIGFPCTLEGFSFVSGLVGSGTGAAAPKYLRSSVSGPRHVTRSVRISRTTRSCTLHDKGYGANRVGAAAQEGG